MRTYTIVGATALFLAAVIEPALAIQQTAPGPIAGIGLPALALIGGAYWLGRKFFGRK